MINKILCFVDNGPDDDAPMADWNIPNAEYSFTPFED